MKKKSIIFSVIILLTTIACEEKEAPALEGDIHGRVLLVDGYGYSLTDKSGVQVQLTGEDTELETTTDSDGQYIFQDLPYGNYQINLIRENYVESDRNFSFSHVGGDAPTAITLAMNEIPEYKYGIDSLKYFINSYTLAIYMKHIGLTKTLTSSMLYIHCFFSDSPDVSYENYEDNIIGYFQQNRLYWIFGYYYYNFLNDYPGTIYCRIYPQTYCDEMWYSGSDGPHPVYPETLGPPSEVFSFTVEEITRTEPGL